MPLHQVLKKFKLLEKRNLIHSSLDSTDFNQIIKQVEIGKKKKEKHLLELKKLERENSNKENTSEEVKYQDQCLEVPVSLYVQSQI